MRLIQVFEATEELDKTEGKGGRRSLGLFLHRPDAELAAKGRGVWGHDGTVSPAWLVTEDGKTGYLIGMSKPEIVAAAATYGEAVRNRVRAMLTEEEWQAMQDGQSRKPKES